MKMIELSGWIWLIFCICIYGNGASGHSVSVKTNKGVVEGYTLNDVSVFEGIPYAKPPKGELRFKVRFSNFEFLI
jgi:hypothetical protein